MVEPLILLDLLDATSFREHSTSRIYSIDARVVRDEVDSTGLRCACETRRPANQLDLPLPAMEASGPREIIS
jgi:hypothetical protein